MSKTTFFIFAGENSGDLHGSHLMSALRQQIPNCCFHGVGGQRMRSEGLDCLLPMEEFQVMGFSDVIKSFPRLFKQFYHVRDAILKTKPQTVILIDYPGFNLRLAKALRKKEFTGKIIQYICPSVWAHGKKRISQMAQSLDLLLTIFPFEAEYFSQTSLKTAYIGNPIAEIVKTHHYRQDWQKRLNIQSADELIALFPGSREGEIKRNFPKQLEAAKMLKNQNNKIRFGISVANDGLLPLLGYHIQKSGLEPGKDVFLVPAEFRYELMKNCRTAIAKSGTITLELALHHTPTVVVYELSALNRFFAKYILKLDLPHYCIVNILAGGMIFPELIAEKFTSQMLYHQVKALDAPGFYRDACKQSCLHVQSILNGGQPSKNAALAILELSQESGVRSQKSEVRSQKSEVRSQK